MKVVLMAFSLQINYLNVLEKLDIKLLRFKTGTPARVNKNSIDFSKMEIQNGDKNIELFSLEDKIDPEIEQLPCYLTYTNAKTHQIIRDNLQSFTSLWW